MERRLGAGTDPAIRGTEGESRSFRRIQGGDAAKAAEESSAQDPGQSHRSFGMSLRATRGARFDLEKNPEAKGEVYPIAASSDSSGQALPVAPDHQQPEETTGGITRKFFRSLFRP